MLESFVAWVHGVIRDMGYPGLFLLITAESTLVPIPSELVMPFAGALAANGDFSLPLVLAINSVAACVGSGISYWIGAAGGKPLLDKYGKYVLIRPKDIAKTEAWFARHGKATIFIGRFLPVVRHVISVPAGVARMPLVPFFTQTFLGATIWGAFLIVLGYELGAHWESVARQIKSVDLVIGAAIIVVFVAFAIRFVIRRRRESTSRAEAQNPTD